jgi:hypothetical protein
MKPRGLGYLHPDPKLLAKRWPITHDRLALRAVTPVGYANNAWQTIETLDQLGLGTCVENAYLELIRANSKKLFPDTIPVLGSRLMAYLLAQIFSGQTDPIIDNGLDPLVGVDALKKHGVCAEHDWPYTDGAAWNKWPKDLARRFHDAYDMHDLEAFFVQSTGARRVDDVKILLDHGYQVFIGGDIGQEFRTWRPGDPPLDPPTVSIGGHAQVIEAYDRDIFTILNSWGSDFGDDGRIAYSADYLASSRITTLGVIKRAQVIPQ